MKNIGIYPRWQVIAYHDEQEDAATDQFTLTGTFESEDAALAEARAWTTTPPDPYWNGGATVHIGTYYPGRFGIEPSRFETDEDVVSKYVYAGEVQ